MKIENLKKDMEIKNYKELCNILGIKGKTEGMDGSLVYDTWQTDPHKVIEYCHDDVTLVKEIHARLTK